MAKPVDAGAGIAVLLSGTGSNLAALLAAGVQVSLVVTDRQDAPGIELARRNSLRCAVFDSAFFPTSQKHDDSLAELLEAAEVVLVVLAGYMRILGAGFCARFAGRAINLHPSLLPEFPGLDTHARALAAGSSVHGCSVHWLAAEVDGGEVIRRAEVPVLPGDDEAALAARVKKVEHELLPEVVGDILAGRIKAQL